MLEYTEHMSKLFILFIISFPIEFPGAAELKLEAWDYDPLFSDELIGLTTIDLEDRYYDHTWLNMKEKPIETRKLYHPDIKGVQGNIKLWVEIFQKDDNSLVKNWNIKLPPVVKYQMRLIIWGTREIPMMDIEETSDVYIAAFVDPKKKQTTDTHFRCVNGEASFNWRILEDIEYDPKSNTTSLSLQVYDKDIFSPDDFICNANINLKSFLSQIYDLDVPFKLTKKYYKSLNLSKEEQALFEFEEEEKFWVNCETIQTEDNKDKKVGGILCSLEILPMWKADQVKVGTGRDEPNCNPYLPPPEGRISWSWNPCVLIGQLVGPRIRRKFVMWFFCILCTIFLLMALPYIVQYVLSEVVNPFNYGSKK